MSEASIVAQVFGGIIIVCAVLALLYVVYRMGEYRGYMRGLDAWKAYEAGKQAAKREIP